MSCAAGSEQHNRGHAACTVGAPPRHATAGKMSISGDSWHKISSPEAGAGADAEAEADASADSANQGQPSLQVQPHPEQSKQQPQSELVVSSANVEEGAAGILLRIRGGAMLFFVIAVWVIGVSQGS